MLTFYLLRWYATPDSIYFGIIFFSQEWRSIWLIHIHCLCFSSFSHKYKTCGCLESNIDTVLYWNGHDWSCQMDSAYYRNSVSNAIWFLPDVCGCLTFQLHKWLYGSTLKNSGCRSAVKWDLNNIYKSQVNCGLHYNFILKESKWNRVYNINRSQVKQDTY